MVVERNSKRKIFVQFTLKNGETAWIRNMKLEDLDQVLELENAIFPDPWTLSNFRHEVALSQVSWPIVAENRYEIVGYAVPWFVEDEMHLANIAVSPLYRRQGVGSMLMTVVLEEALARGARRAFLEVRPSNLDAIRLYKKFGFEKVGYRRRYYRNGEDALVMQRYLPQQFPVGQPKAEE